MLHQHLSQDDAPDTIKIAARGIVVVVAHLPGAVCQIDNGSDIPDLELHHEEGVGCACGVLWFAPLPRVCISVSAVGGIKYLLNEPTYDELTLLSLEQLRAIVGAFKVVTSARTVAGLAKAILAHVA